MELAKKRVDENSIQVQDMVNSIIGDKTTEIDTYMATVRTLFLNDAEIPNEDLDRIILRLPVFIYYLNSLLQEIDIRKGVSAEQARYVENEFLLTATGTVAEKQAIAENKSLTSRIVQIAYKSAVAIIQGKISGAAEILSSAKRVQRRRMDEANFSRMVGGSVEGVY